MASIYEIMFTIQFLVVILITMGKLYNVMSFKKPIYDIRIGVLLFIGVLIGWFIGMVVLLLRPTTVLYLQLLRFENYLLMFNLLFLFIEIIYILIGKDKQVKPYSALQNMK